MKNNRITFIIYGVIAIIAIFLLIMVINNIFEENLYDESGNDLGAIYEDGLGSLCSGEDECQEFCLNNRGTCESYCRGSENELCAIMFPTKEGYEQTPIATEGVQECEGAKVKFDYAPVNLDKTLVMLPRGLMVGDHVTPVNHHYFQNFDNDKYDIEVYSPGDGLITNIGHMPDAEEGKDYHITIKHACTVSAYYIYVSNLPEKIYNYIRGKEYARVQIPVEAGEIIGYYKNNLDYNLIDEEVELTGFVVPEHYELESYKIHIVPNTYEYFNEPVKSKMIAISVRTAEPISGKIDYDIDGKLVGNWFLEGTHGYSGDKPEKYWEGHLSFVYDYIDPGRIVISISGYDGQDSKQFGINGNVPDPATVSIEDGLVKYGLVDYSYITPGGNNWDSKSAVKNLRTISNEIVRGIVLVQMIENRKIKFEAFPGKTFSEVNAFTTNAKIYER